jgi:hypothetical protein
MKSLFLALALLFTMAQGAVPLSAYARQLKDFNGLMTALEGGETVRVIIDYGRCSLIIDGKPADAPKAIGGMSVDVFEYFAQMAIGNPMAFVVFSEVSLINHPKRGFVQNYVKFKVKEDNSVDVTAQYLKPNSLEIVMDETFTSVIADGKNHGAVSFFAD